MGKRAWFSSVRKALNLHPKGKEAKRANKSKKKWFGKGRKSGSKPFEIWNPHPLPQLEIRDPRAQAAAIKIQTAFRGYLARRALRALRGLVRLKSLIDGPTAGRQTTNTLKKMQTLSRLQSQIQSRRMRMLDENRALHRQMLHKRSKQLDCFRMAEEWDDSLQSKEEVEASLLHKYEAAVKRERALAYSYTHQQTWKKSAKATNILFMDPTNPSWGWSWLERWMDSFPLLTKTSAGKDYKTAGEITKAFARHKLKSDSPPPPAVKEPPSSHNAPVVPPPKAVPARKLKLAIPKVSKISQDGEKSMLAIHSYRIRRRHSIAGSSIRDEESLENSPPIPGYMTPTRSAKAKSKLQRMVKNGKSDKESSGIVKKRLSFPHSPARDRRHSGLETRSGIM